MTSTMEHRRGWWRRNRWGLVALPLALVLALAAGSSRLHEYWWKRGFHEQAPVSSGVATLTDEYDDGYLRYPIEARYSVASFRPADDVTLYGGDPLPSGVRAWRLSLAVEADPDVALSGCTVALVDTAGNRHGATDSGLDVDAPRLASCVPESTPGPRTTYGSTAPPAVPDGEDPRPPTYRTDTVFVLPAEAVPAAVRLWYALPRYVELPVDASAD
ncbi:hypothetical protein AFL01nite_00610 [Aeromicrobium flavum]|uniref:Uncharacterized protein n=1 Tax=Aeromicrobium flavum TaxID=416568 RepID=A0A512HQK4_9ACTN|nr:hypothetical protein [Aeromicrobium flavum]GEO87734.1 hypothetical protein AFL01nite_00610 [Aeromicrobium flavum]